MAIPLICAAIMAGMGGGAIPYLQSRTYYNLGVIVKGSGSAAANVTFGSDGVLSTTSTITVGPAINTAREWLGAAGSPSGWHIRAELVSGTTPSGPALNTWHAMTASRTWTLSRNEPSDGTGKTSCVLTIKFSNDGGSTTFSTWTSYVTLEAELTL